MAKRLYSFLLQVLLLVGILSSTQAAVDTVPEPCNSTTMATATNQLFISPGHPGNYSNDAFCEWNFESPEGTTILIEFTAFILERGFDFIRVFENGSVQERFTGDLTSSLPSYTSITNKVNVQFTSDEIIPRTGFSAYFRIAEVGNWSNWSACSEECGIGSQNRTRDCTGDCDGVELIQFQACSTQPCPPEVGDWSNWSACSEECGIGSQNRTRDCTGDCDGVELIQFQACSTQPCPPEVGDWSNWSACSEECGTGSRNRTRYCTEDCDGVELIQFQACSTQPCPPDRIAFFCEDDSATLTIDQNGLDELGVGYYDYLIINDVVEDDVSGSGSGGFDSNCKLLGDNGGGSLTFSLDECNPAVENTDTYIIFTWYARNAEQGNVKRKNHCFEITCKYSREEYLTAPPVAVTLTKLELEEISGSGEIPVKLETFLDFDREFPSRSFNVPEPIYVRAYIDSAVPTSFYVQIDCCFASDLTDTETYMLIDDGVADTSDPEGGVVALVPPGTDYVPLQQDFQFNSFTWTEDDQDNAIVIHCNIYLCDSDEVGLDCATTMLAPVGDGSRRKRMIADDYRRKVSSKPISITKR